MILSFALITIGWQLLGEEDVGIIKEEKNGQTIEVSSESIEWEINDEKIRDFLVDKGWKKKGHELKKIHLN